MSPIRMLKRTDPNDPFASVLREEDAAESVLLQSARDANAATVIFDAERRRLRQCRVAGDLLLVQQQQAL